MIGYTPEAIAQIDALRLHYRQLNRLEAARNLDRAPTEAEKAIADRPRSALPAPRPYPFLSRPGRDRIKAGRYWIAFRAPPSPVITGVFYETADIPGRS